MPRQLRLRSAAINSVRRQGLLSAMCQPQTRCVPSSSCPADSSSPCYPPTNQHMGLGTGSAVPQGYVILLPSPAPPGSFPLKFRLCKCESHCRPGGYCSFMYRILFRHSVETSGRSMYLFIATSFRSAADTIAGVHFRIGTCEKGIAAKTRQKL